MTVYLDIETTTAAELLIAGLIAAGLITPEEDLGRTLVRPDAVAWVLEHAADRALDPHGGRVVCWAIATSDDRDVVRAGPNEAALLGELLGMMRTFEPSRIVAWNGSGLDFPFLRARALARQIPELARWFWSAKPWDDRLIDPTTADWFPRPASGSKYGTPKGWTYTLDSAASLLGVERPPTTPGAEVPAAWYLGRAEAVAAHCLDDVRTLRTVTRLLAEGRGEP